MAEARVITKELLGLEDILTGDGTVTQTRGGVSLPITKLNAGNINYDASQTIKAVVDGKVEALLNIAALKATATTNGKTQYKFLLGYSSAGDGGGGLFWLDTSDVLSAEDLSLVFEPDVVANGRWKRVDPEDQVSDDNGDANLVLTAASEGIQLFDTVLTVDRTVTLPSVDLFNGVKFKFIYTKASAFTLAIDTVYTFAASDAGTVEVTYNGTTWEVTELSTNKPKTFNDTAAGTVDALTVSVGMKAYANGDVLFLRSLGANTVTAPTINIDALGLRTITKNGNSALEVGDMGGTNRELILKYNSTTSKFELLNPPAAVSESRTGEIVTWPLDTPKTGTLICDGTAKNRTTYADLFAIIGTTYGIGDGTTTFNIPDYQGEFLRGQDNASAKDPDAASRTDRGDGTTGDAVGTKQADQFKLHTHPLSASASANGSTGVTRQSSTPASTGGLVLGSGGNETRPRNVNVLYCIVY